MDDAAKVLSFVCKATLGAGSVGNSSPVCCSEAFSSKPQFGAVVCSGDHGKVLTGWPLVPRLLRDPNDNYPTPDLGKSSSSSVAPWPVAPFSKLEITFGRLGISGFCMS
ncbi:hypothetical protein BGW80DRAFT_1259619 [Lactifluus volemus]|nr:hypothetical protein BGW80DRAFT_1259619 [Lactifluus volemus]